MTNSHEIARWRLRNQHLVRPLAGSAGEVVRSLLAVQAENPRQSEWAVACRTADPAASDLAALLADGTVLRTHVLRTTWHYVPGEDLGWLLDLSAQRLRRNTGQQLDRALGAEGPSGLDRATSVVMEALAGRPDRTRGELAEELRQAGFDTSGTFVMLLLAHLELGGLVCSGRPREEEHTYAVLSERVRLPRRLDRDEALAECALRYFTGHGPATERDLVYWATLSAGEVRRGLDAVRDRLESFEHEGRTYWHAPGDPPRDRGEPAGHLLQVLDEMYRGYQDSRWALDPPGVVPRVREAAIGMALVDAQLVASMRRVLTGRRVTFELSGHRPLAGWERAELLEAAARYGAYLGLEPRLVIDGSPA